ncbi:MAG TPA: glycine cleavage T C-terminal barrel domain-containing protein [Pirellulales bacterium]|nr:glycine cleavage T C-terminal barrel domain-containing protein [Pirellulales bacterium]
MQTFEQQYQALTEAAGLVDFTHRTRIEVTGDDRAGFLHNLSTNDVKRLQPDSGCEAFLLDARGHVRGHVFLICRRESFIIETVAAQDEFLLNHLNRYLIREKVELHDRGGDWSELLVAGDGSGAVLEKIASGTLPRERLASTELLLAGEPVTLVRVDITRSGGYLLLFGRASQAIVREALISQGAIACDSAALEAARLEAGFPWYGIDISDQNLPQEVGRDALAISFNKGCYIGQETVARIDALGHVNKTLVRLRYEGEQVPSPGAELLASGHVAGHVTSAAFSPRAGAPLALGYVRRGSNQPSSVLESAVGPAAVV